MRPCSPGSFERVDLVEQSESRTKNRVVETRSISRSFHIHAEERLRSWAHLTRPKCASRRGHFEELFISAEEAEGPLEEVPGKEETERNRRKAS